MCPRAIIINPMSSIDLNKLTMIINIITDDIKVFDGCLNLPNSLLGNWMAYDSDDGHKSFRETSARWS